MLGWFQKCVYYLLALCPPILLSIIPLIEEYFDIALLSAAGVLIFAIYMFVSLRWLKWCTTKIPTTNVVLSSVEPYDIQNMTVLLTYILPMVSMMLTDDTNILIGVFLVVFMFIVTTLMNTVLPNPFFIFRYHLYKVSIRDGVSGFLLMSKRQLTSVKQVKKIYWVFDYFGIDADV